jgi:hypothetical protein
MTIRNKNIPALCTRELNDRISARFIEKRRCKCSKPPKLSKVLLGANVAAKFSKALGAKRAPTRDKYCNAAPEC